jgi:hypothetical protein
VETVSVNCRHFLTLACSGEKVVFFNLFGYFLESALADLLGMFEGIGDFTFGGSAWLMEQATSLVGLTPNQVSEASGDRAALFRYQRHGGLPAADF